MISDGTRLALLDGPIQGSDAVRMDVGALEGDIPWLRRAGMQVMEVLGEFLKRPVRGLFPDTSS
jgi:hypothetical protein